MEGEWNRAWRFVAFNFLVDLALFVFFFAMSIASSSFMQLHVVWVLLFVEIFNVRERMREIEVVVYERSH